MRGEEGKDESNNDAVGGKLNALGDRRRRFLLLFASLLISIFTLLLLLNLTTSRETFIALEQINPIFLLLAFLIHIFALTIWSLRLKILSDFVSERRNGAKCRPAGEYENQNHCDCGVCTVSGEAVEKQRRRRWKRQCLKFSDSLKIVFASLFGACITPSQFGGEPIRIYLLNKKGLSVGDSTVVVFGERVFDFFVVMVGAFLGSLFLWHATSSAILKAFCMFFGVVFCLGVVAVTFCVSKPESVCGVFERIFSAIERFA
ncbi:MAG: flippase-like domain-containing protein, partial [Methanophagales archaeon]|nr:flippase-like domain-containing protein [Methanophagales archaeon]